MMGSPDRYAGLDTESYLGPIEPVATIEDTAVQLEGPTMAADGKLYFTNSKASKILIYDPSTNEVSTFRDKTNGANGMLFDRNGDLLVCEGGKLTFGDAPGRVVRINVKTGELTVLAELYNNFELQPPNDVAFDDKGHIFFSSRQNEADATDATKGTINGVYRLDADGKLTLVLGYPEVHRPNGLAVSNDYSKLYVIDAHGAENMNRHIVAYDLDASGNVSNPRVVYTFYPGRSGDGMRIDEKGNLYVAAGLHATRGTSETLDTKPGIHVISPEGKLLAFREVPVDLITNCAFAGDDLKTLYITDGAQLVRLRTVIAGNASYRPKASP